MAKTPISVAYGDGIGPEIMQAVLSILDAAGAHIAPEIIEIGEKSYLSGHDSGIPEQAWQSMIKTGVILKAPITTPIGKGYKSLNVAIRKSFGLYANIRPCKSYRPFVPSNFPEMDMVIFRENEEGLYAGIEYRQTQNVYEGLKLISEPGSVRIIRAAFEYAKAMHRQKVTCIVKDNIMKLTDGMFHGVFDDIAKEYPDIENEHLLMDIGTALIAADPERFDVIVTGNLYGDIISDVSAQVAGSVGLAGSANIGRNVAMFEAIHGSAPDIAEKNIANPSGLLNGAIMMLLYIDQAKVASLIENAWLKTIEDGIHTGDIADPKRTDQKVGTDEFAHAVIDRLGKNPEAFTTANYPTENSLKQQYTEIKRPKNETKTLVGVDIFLDVAEIEPFVLAKKLQTLTTPLSLTMIDNRGLEMWPKCPPVATKLDHWRARFQSDSDLTPIKYQAVVSLMDEINTLGLEIIKTENLYTFSGKKGFR